MNTKEIEYKINILNNKIHNVSQSFKYHQDKTESCRQELLQLVNRLGDLKNKLPSYNDIIEITVDLTK